MRILNVLCHPHRDSLTGQALDRFIEGARSSGLETDLIVLYPKGVDLSTYRHAKRGSGSESSSRELARQQRLAARADALCLAFETSWFGMPAKMTDWLERVWSTQWAYRVLRSSEPSFPEPRPCTLLVTTRARLTALDEAAFATESERLWRMGVFADCGLDSIRVQTMLEDKSDPARMAAYLDAAFEAGVNCMRPRA